MFRFTATALNATLILDLFQLGRYSLPFVYSFALFASNSRLSAPMASERVRSDEAGAASSELPALSPAEQAAEATRFVDEMHNLGWQAITVGGASALAVGFMIGMARHAVGESLSRDPSLLAS